MIDFLVTLARWFEYRIFVILLYLGRFSSLSSGILKEWSGVFENDNCMPSHCIMVRWSRMAAMAQCWPTRTAFGDKTPFDSRRVFPCRRIVLAHCNIREIRCREVGISRCRR